MQSPLSSSRQGSFLVTDAFDDMFAEDEAGLGENALDYARLDEVSIALNFENGDTHGHPPKVICKCKH